MLTSASKTLFLPLLLLTIVLGSEVCNDCEKDEVDVIVIKAAASRQSRQHNFLIPLPYQFPYHPAYQGPLVLNPFQAPPAAGLVPGIVQPVNPQNEVVKPDDDDDKPVNDKPVNDKQSCGVGKYKIRYLENGADEEAMERATAINTRVRNGWEAEVNEWPWIAALYRTGRDGFTKVLFCGGSLIDDRHILTAAHCVFELTPTDVAGTVVRLGEHNIKDPSETQVFESKVTQVKYKKGFSIYTMLNDVAILTLETPVPASFGDTIRPVCLPTGNDRYAGKMATVIGWGALYKSGPQPAVLQELTMEVWEQSKCASTYAAQSIQGAPAITSGMMCAGGLAKDSCNGDSGGPLVIPEGSHWTQVGIVSFGIGCGETHLPGVYTRVNDVMDWIEKITKGTSD